MLDGSVRNSVFGPPSSDRPYLEIWPKRIWFIAELLPITAMYGAPKRLAVSMSNAVMPKGVPAMTMTPAFLKASLRVRLK